MEVHSSEFDQMNPRFDDFDLSFKKAKKYRKIKRMINSVILFASFVTLMTILLPFLSKCINAQTNFNYRFPFV